MTKYGKLLLLISLIDLFITILLINSDRYIEANPILEKALDHGGMVSLALVKVSMTIFFVGIIEILWERQSVSRNKLQKYFRATIILNIILYILFFFIVNR